MLLKNSPVEIISLIKIKPAKTNLQTKMPLIKRNIFHTYTHFNLIFWQFDSF